jgi:hypothetical protein
VTILTDMPFGVKKLIPMQWHGYLELVVGLALVISPGYFRICWRAVSCSSH